MSGTADLMGCAINDLQVKNLLRVCQAETLQKSAMLSGMSVPTARKYLRLGLLPSEVRVPHTWRTRKDPFADVADEIGNMLSINNKLPATEVLVYLQHRYPGRFGDGQLRTLQRRLRSWRALNVPKEVFFAQIHEPGQWLQIDWTDAGDLGVTISSEPFVHKLCHSILPYSNWEWAIPCHSENFLSLQALLRQTANHAGGLPVGLQMDNSSTVTHREEKGRVFNRYYSGRIRKARR